MTARWILAIGALSLLSACASQPGASKAVAEQEVPDKHCLKYTGSRAKPADRCAIAIGRVFTPGDLNRTGGISVEESLDRLIP